MTHRLNSAPKTPATTPRSRYAGISQAEKPAFAVADAMCRADASACKACEATLATKQASTAVPIVLEDISFSSSSNTKNTPASGALKAAASPAPAPAATSNLSFSGTLLAR
jgi:membrane protein involved in colicin uptake